MKATPILTVILLGTILLACHEAPKEKAAIAIDSTAMPMAHKYPASLLDNKKDPSCGMPITAGIEDTMHYNNKVIGFCSKECRADFEKNLAKNFAAVEWKK